MLQMRENRRLITYFIAIVAILSWAITLIGTGLLNPIEFGAAFKYLGIATSIAWISAELLYRRCWRWSFIKNLLKIPDLSGRWEGWTYPTLNKEQRASAHEFTQQGLDIVGNAWGPDNWARNLCASLVSDRFDGPYELVWSYKTDSTTSKSKAGDIFTGTEFLRFSERNGKKYLEGKYITERAREDSSFGSVGYINLIHVSKNLKGAHTYNEKTWGLQKQDVNFDIIK